jgi:hypothetical protein
MTFSDSKPVLLIEFLVRMSPTQFSGNSVSGNSVFNRSYCAASFFVPAPDKITWASAQVAASMVGKYLVLAQDQALSPEDKCQDLNPAPARDLAEALGLGGEMGCEEIS